MKRFTACGLFVLVLAGCASQGRDGGNSEQVTLFKKGEESVIIHSTFGSSQVRGWRVIDDSTMLIETSSKGDLVATFQTPCPGLRFAEVVGFRTMGPFELDRTTTVILPDGRRCYFQELNPHIKLDSGQEETR